jgi:hypothetical protein
VKKQYCRYGTIPGSPVQNPISMFQKGIFAFAVIFKMKYKKNLSVGEADTKIYPK